MHFFNVTISGMESLWDEIEEQKLPLQNALYAALERSGAELIAALQKRIQTDWYRAYLPKNYDRRTDTGEGTAIGSEKTMDYVAARIRNGAGLVFSYEPESNEWIPPGETLTGDHLINILQTGKGGFWDGKVPPRPFWNAFLSELENGEFIKILSREMKQEGYTIVSDNTEVNLAEYKLDE